MFFRQLLLSIYAIFKQLPAPEKAVHIKNGTRYTHVYLSLLNKSHTHLFTDNCDTHCSEK